MNTFEKIKIAGGLALQNPRLFWKYTAYRLKRFTPTWKNLKLKKGIADLGGVRFEINFDELGLDYFTKQMYFGCYQIALIEILKQQLKPGDVFLDVGANVGYVSAVGAGLVGTTGQVHCFEPVPQYARSLRRLAELNPSHTIAVNAMALGDIPGTLQLDSVKPPYSGGSSLVKGLVDLHGIPREFVETIEVPIVRLDQYIQDRGIKRISAIKIDVEGFEFPVLRGLERYFQTTGERPAILCEITTPAAYATLGTSLQELVDYMQRYGYRAYDIMNPRKLVDITQLTRGADVLFRS